jgi:hypothetical protein
MKQVTLSQLLFNYGLNWSDTGQLGSFRALRSVFCNLESLKLEEEFKHSALQWSFKSLGLNRASESVLISWLNGGLIDL